MISSRRELSKYIEKHRPSEIRVGICDFDALHCAVEPIPEMCSTEDNFFWYRGVKIVLDHDAASFQE